ncbi:MAG: two-component system response regulator CreB [Myxococcota bacterium]
MAKDRVLLIEDERTIAETLIYALEREGFEVQWCPTGAEGLKWFRQHDTTFVILDIGLPDQNGLDICRTLRSESHVPILFLTARAEEVDRILGLELGADDYVTKPFSPREVVARIRTILRRLQNSMEDDDPTPILRKGPFKQDHDKMKIYFHDQALDLSHYEFRVLALLLKRPGKVFTREEILERAWDEPEMTMDRTIDAHIKRIRKKIREINAEDPIRTVRGVGYTLDIEAS